MLGNLSLIFLTFSNTFQSPIISHNSIFLANYATFQQIKINRIFNSFLYKNFINTNRQTFLFKDSSFSNSLSSVINLAGDTTIIDQVNSSQLYLKLNDPSSNKLEVINSCFSHCMSTVTYIDGGAIHVDIPFCLIIITNSIFTRCKSAGVGGAICTIGHGVQSS